MSVVNTIEQRRKAIEDQMEDQAEILHEINARCDILHKQYNSIIAEELASKSKQKHIERINALLETARQALEEAGMIGEEHGIDFSFQGPREEIIFNNKWMSSDCYGANNKWYGQGFNPNHY